MGSINTCKSCGAPYSLGGYVCEYCGTPYEKSNRHLDNKNVIGYSRIVTINGVRVYQYGLKDKNTGEIIVGKNMKYKDYIKRLSFAIATPESTCETYKGVESGAFYE